MNDTSRPISIDFSDITIIGGKRAWIHSTSCGISLTGHEHPHENVRGLLRMRNVSISETPAAGLRLTSKAAVGSMWGVELEDLRLENVATSWPMPAVATTKDPYPCATVSYRLLHDPSLSIDPPSFSLFFGSLLLCQFCHTMGTECRADRHWLVLPRRPLSLGPNVLQEWPVHSQHSNRACWWDVHQECNYYRRA